MEDKQCFFVFKVNKVLSVKQSELSYFQYLQSNKKAFSLLNDNHFLKGN